ncbi:MAG: NAD-dependent epimerase/dehydratase family protein, partial [Chloroflexota bacterium]
MRILITGGAGFIGSHLADRLIAEDHQLTVLDDLSGGARSNVPDGAAFEQADVTEADLNDVLARHRPEIIVHCAARASVSHSMSQPLADYRANQLAAFRLAQASARQAVGHLILLSTSGIYGPVERPAKETDRPAPANYYGIHKWAAERYFALSGVPWTALRLANVYGPRQRSDSEGGAVAIFLSRVLSGESIPLYGAGAQTRDYVYVADIVSAIVAAIDHRLTGVWNVGSGQETPIRAILDAVVAATGRAANVRIEPARPGDVASSALDASHL